MKSPYPDIFGFILGKTGNPFPHLVCGFIGKSHRQNISRAYIVLLYKIRDSFCDYSCFPLIPAPAKTRRGPPRVFNRFLLRVIEIILAIRCHIVFIKMLMQRN